MLTELSLGVVLRGGIRLLFIKLGNELTERLGWGDSATEFDPKKVFSYGGNNK